MITVKKEGVLLEKTELDFENLGVLNPAVFQEGNTVHILYRAVRVGNFSSIGYCKAEGPLRVVLRYGEPLLAPASGASAKGIEDPRIVKIEGVFYVTYTAYDGISALGGLATSRDLIEFERYEIISPEIVFADFMKIVEGNKMINPKYFKPVQQTARDMEVLLWDKDVVFFPRRINGKLTFLHRIRPGIQIVAVNELEELTEAFWHEYFLNFDEHIVLDPISAEFESSFVGGGCPPIESEKGWIVIYHGVRHSAEGYVYSACAALLDLEEPGKIIARLPYPLFVPEFEYELNGVVSRVVFPTGTALFGDRLYVYYGAADQCIACASMSIKELTDELMLNHYENEKIDYALTNESK